MYYLTFCVVFIVYVYAFVSIEPTELFNLRNIINKPEIDIYVRPSNVKMKDKTFFFFGIVFEANKPAHQIVFAVKPRFIYLQIIKFVNKALAFNCVFSVFVIIKIPFGKWRF